MCANDTIAWPGAIAGSLRHIDSSIPGTTPRSHEMTCASLMRCIT